MPPPQGRERIAAGRRRIVLLAVLLPLCAGLFGVLGGKVGIASLPLHPAAKLAALVLQQERGQLPGPPPDELTAYRQHGADRAAVMATAAAMEARFLTLGRWLGAAVGLVLALKLTRAMFPAGSRDYETDSGRCVSCARCFTACPYELVRRGFPLQIPPQGGHDG